MPSNITCADEESNVYNHMVETDNDNYDAMKSTKSLHLVGRIDETYSHMNDRFVIHDYCGLSEPTEVRERRVDTDKESIKNKRCNV